MQLCGDVNGQDTTVTALNFLSDIKRKPLTKYFQILQKKDKFRTNLGNQHLLNGKK